jgi:hypothetical protein
MNIFVDIFTDELYILIFSFLEFKYLIKLTQLNNHFKSLIRTNEWKVPVKVKYVHKYIYFKNYYNFTNISVEYITDYSYWNDMNKFFIKVFKLSIFNNIKELYLSFEYTEYYQLTDIIYNYVVEKKKITTYDLSKYSELLTTLSLIYRDKIGIITQLPYNIFEHRI